MYRDRNPDILFYRVVFLNDYFGIFILVYYTQQSQTQVYKSDAIKPFCQLTWLPWRFCAVLFLFFFKYTQKSVNKEHLFVHSTRLYNIWISLGIFDQNENECIQVPTLLYTHNFPIQNVLVICLRRLSYQKVFFCFCFSPRALQTRSSDMPYGVCCCCCSSIDRHEIFGIYLLYILFVIPYKNIYLFFFSKILGQGSSSCRSI